MPVYGGRKKNDNKWIPDAIEGTVDKAVEIAGNFGDDVRDLAGLPRGLYEVGKSVGHDAGKAIGVAKGEWRSDDIAASILKDYKRVYQPLWQGDLATFGRRVAEHPLGPVLDLLTVVTGGAALGGKIGHAAAKGGSVTGAKVAGLRPATAADPVTTLGRMEARGGKVFVPQKLTLNSGEHVVDFPLSGNPLVRSRQRKVGALGQAHPQLPFIGADRRIARHEDRRLSLEQSTLSRAARKDGAKVARKLNRDEQAAFAVLAGGFHSPQGLVDFYSKRQGRLEKSDEELAVLRKLRAEGDEAARELAVKELFAHEHAKVLGPAIDTRLGRLRSKRTAALVANPNKRVLEALQATRNLSESTTARLQKMARKEGREGPRADRAFLEQRVVHDANRQGAAEAHQPHAMAERAMTDTEAATRVAEIDAELRTLLRGRQERWRKANAKGVRRTQSFPLFFEDLRRYLDGEVSEGVMLDRFGIELPRAERALELYDEAAALERGERALIAEASDVPFEFTDFIGVGDPIIRSHELMSRRYRRAVGRKKPPGSAQYSRGWNFEFALDSLHPGTAIRAYHDALKWEMGVKRFDTMMQYARPKADIAPSDMKHYREFSTKDSRLFLDRIDAVLEQAEVVFGEAPQIERLRKTFQEEFAGKFSGDVVLVPKAIHDRLLGEVNRSSGFIDSLMKGNRKITSIWRAAVLNLRPAWIVNNLVGQTMLLLASQSLLKSARGVLMTMPGTEGRRLIDEYAGGVLEHGFGRTERLYRKHGGDLTLGQKAVEAFKVLPDGMARINAVLTDDAPRRARFYELLRPEVKRLQKNDPSLSFADAAELILNDDAARSHIATRVLDDLVDFRDLNNVERGIREFVPFYSWIRGSALRTGRLIADDPHKALALKVLSDYGGQAGEEQYGAMPSYLRGAIPAPAWVSSILGGNPDHPALITTNGMNPFQTPADTYAMLSGIFASNPTGGDNPLAQLGPVAKSGVEALTNRTMFGGFPVMRGDEGSWGQKFAKQMALSTPQSQSAAKLLRAPSDSPTLYDHSALSELLRYLGLPAKRVNPLVAAQRAEEG